MDVTWVIPLVLILLAFSSLIMRIILPRLIQFLKGKGKIGIDVHKLDKPEVAEMGGVGVLIVACISATIPLILFDNFIVKIQMVVFISVIGLAGLIGLVDDLFRLGSKIKPLLVAGASFPLLLANYFYYNEIFYVDPKFPLIGEAFRLTYIYPLLIPVAITMAANAVNMIDVVNGSMSGPSIIIFATLLICSLTKPIYDQFAITGAFLSAIMLGVIIIFFLYNRYPAKVFAGDTGALTIGAGLALVGIMGRLEIVTVIVAIPLVINAFQLLASVRGFVEGRKLKSRPSIVKSDGTLAASTDIKAPLTLMRIVMARGPLKEPEITRQFIKLTLFCSVLAFVTHYLVEYINILA